MAKPIPKWVQERFSILYQEYGKKELSFEMIKDVLTLDDRNTISVFLSELRNAEWIDIKLNPEDSRKRIYILKEPNKIMQEIFSDESKRNKS